MKGLWMVARREIIVRGRTKGFVISLLVTVVLMIGLTLLPTLLGGDSKYTIAVTGEGSTELAAAIDGIGESGESDLDITVEEVDDANAARAAVEEGTADVAVVDDTTIISDGDVDQQLGLVIDGAHSAVVTQRQLAEAGLDPQLVGDALTVTPLERESIDGEEDGARTGIAILVVILMFFLLMSPTMYVATGVVEEKSSRIVEILLSSLKTWQLLGGKILGLGVLGFVNIVVIAASALGGAAATGLISDLPDGIGSVALSAIVWWILAYAFFASLAGALSSMVSRQEDMSSTLTPLTLLMTGCYLVAFIGTSQPGSMMTLVLSYVPPFSSFMMPVREAAGDVELWQSAASAGLMLLASIGVMAIASTIYKRSVMRTGSRVKVKDLFSKAS
ncbi:ABC-type Na+ efflux pump permease component-like protein [Stackebrandtia soli]